MNGPRFVEGGATEGKRPRRARQTWARWLCAAALASFQTPATATEVGLSQLGLETWSPEVGLAGSWVRDIAQDREGFLWIATSGGLSRFDGHGFVNFTAAVTPGLPANSVAALAVAPDGRLWLGLDHGGVRVLRDGAMRIPEEVSGLPAVGVRSLLAAADGVLWIATDRGLWRSGARGAERLDLAGPGLSEDVWSLTAAPDGAIWARTRGHGLWRIAGGVPRREADAPGCLGLDLAFHSDGRPVTSCVDGVWERLPASDAWVRRSPVRRAQRLLVDRTGAVWFGSEEGLVRQTPEHGDELLPPHEGVGDWRTRALFEDGAGDLWVGSFSSGLARLRRGPVLAIGRREGLAASGPTAVLVGPDGSLWLGTFASGLLRWPLGRAAPRQADGSPDRAQRWTVASGLPSDTVWTVAADPRRPSRLVLGTARGLVELDGGRIRRLARPAERSDDEVTLVWADPAAPGTFWLAGPGGGAEQRRDDGGETRHDAGNGLEAGRIRAFHRDRAGRLLAGGDGGVFVLDGDRWRELGLPAEDRRGVRAIAEETNGRLWIASAASGLLRWSEGSVVRLGEREGFLSNAIYSLAIDRGRSLWLSGEEGLMRLRLEDFDRWTRGELDSVPLERLSARDGLRDRECNGWGQPAVTVLPDGRLAYPTATGIAMLDPQRVPPARLEPTTLFVDRAVTGIRPLDLAAPLRLDPPERDLRIHFGAREFLRPEAVRFRHRLEGLDARWVTAGSQREAVYSNLPPGRFRFRLQARLPGQEWVESPAPLALTVAPRLSESRGFRVALFLAAALATAAVVLWRSRVQRAHARAIARERAFLREVIDTSPNPIFAKARDLTFSLANRAAAAVYGLAPRDLVGRGDADLASGLPDLRRLEEADREVLQTGEERASPEERIVDASGATRWFRVVKRPLRGADGEVEQILGTAVDVTDFKLAELSLRRREAELRNNREELRRLARQLIRAQEDERSRLAREIHDDLTQRLAGLAMLTGSLAQLAARDPAGRLAPRLEQVRQELERLASDAQALSRDLHPSLLENLGLEAALRSEVATFRERTGLRARFESREVPEGLAAEQSLALYRIAQEALRNALTHAPDAPVVVTLERDGEELVLRVDDEGAGFDPAAIAGRSGMGLASMAERTRLIGGTFGLDAAPGRGTRITVRVPLVRTAPGDDATAGG